MNLFNGFRKLIHLPPRAAAAKVRSKAAEVYGGWMDRCRLRYESTYLAVSETVGPLPALWSVPSAEELGPYSANLQRRSEAVLSHVFDLLGSGPVKVSLGSAPEGFAGVRFSTLSPVVRPDREGRWLGDRLPSPCVAEARRRWSLVDPSYHPLDWQLDFRSGYRWGARTPSRALIYGKTLGADIKVPWELGRLQHLPSLAYAYVLSKETEGFRKSEAYLAEFRNQVLDFTAQNPPRWGAQWVCTMDVAIRAANLALAHGFFLSAGAVFDEAFEGVFGRVLLEHGRFIVGHLEWDPNLRSNHYLADVAGLLFVAAALPSSPETDAWLAYATQEVASEASIQFHPDGSNFEASTSYHRLSGEMVLFATALVLGLSNEKKKAFTSFDPSLVQVGAHLGSSPLPLYDLPSGEGKTPFDEGHFVRLAGMGEFIRSFSHGDGCMPQFGDNDSGRFFRLEPDDLLMLDHRPLVASVDGLKEEAQGREWAGNRPEEAWVRRWAKGRTFRLNEGEALPSGSGMGMTRLAGDGFFVALRCGEAGQKGNGGHAHADLGCLELSYQGCRFVVDPGTYVYTADANARNAFRSSEAHNALVLVGVEPTAWLPGPEGLFSMTRWPQAHLTVEPGSLKSDHEGFGGTSRRHLTLKPGRLEGEDVLAVGGPKRLSFRLHPQVFPRPLGKGFLLEQEGACLFFESSHTGWTLEETVVSPAYGVRLKTKALTLLTQDETVRWSFASEARA